MNDLYHVRHWCRDCHKEFDHSQGTWDELRQQQFQCPRTGNEHRFVTVATPKLSNDSEKRKRQWFAISFKMTA